MKPLASGNPLVMDKAAVDAEVARLSRARRAFEDRSFSVRLDLSLLPERIRQAEDAVTRIDGDIARRIDTSGDRFRIEIGGQHLTARCDAASRLRRVLMTETYASAVRRIIRIGHFAGFDLEACVQRGFPPELILRGQHEHTASVQLEDSSATGNLQTLEHLPRRMEAAKQKIEQKAEHLRQQFAELEALSRATFAEQDALDRTLARQRELDTMLGEQAEDRRVDLSTLEVTKVEPEETADLAGVQ